MKNLFYGTIFIIIGVIYPKEIKTGDFENLLTKLKDDSHNPSNLKKVNSNSKYKNSLSNYDSSLKKQLNILNTFNLDEEGGGHKKSILETLHNKSEQEQEIEMLKFWDNQMKLVNEESKTEKIIKVKDFDIKITQKCEINTNLLEKHFIDKMMLNKGPLANRDFPIKHSVKDCLEGTEDARKWFVSTMHIYIKNMIDIPEMNSKHDESFFKSLYSAYITEKTEKDSQNAETKVLKEKKLNNIKKQCFDLQSKDVIDPFGEALFDLDKKYIPKLPDFYEMCFQDEHSKILSSIRAKRENITKDSSDDKVLNSLLKLNNKTILDASFEIEPKDDEKKIITKILENDLPLSNKEFFESTLNLLNV